MDIARKIVISRWPEVYHMNQEEFNNWVLSLSPEDENWIERKIVNVIFKKNFTTMEQVDDYIEDMDLADKGVLNKEKLYYSGVGKDFFTFNEQDNKGLLLNIKPFTIMTALNFCEGKRLFPSTLPIIPRKIMSI